MKSLTKFAKFGQLWTILDNCGQNFSIHQKTLTFVQQIAPEPPVINYFIHPFKNYNNGKTRKLY